MELDIQKLAEDLIARTQRQSRVYGEQSDRLKWVAEGMRELHEAIRRAAAQLATEEFADKLVPSGDGDAD